MIRYFCIREKEERIMARLIRPSWAIRCVQSGCKTLFEVAKVEDGKQQEVVCPNCGEAGEAGRSGARWGEAG